ncbi:lysophospholipase L1-like esterase [Jatrophihabitans sp. GAS493]|uniref:SGNH/GDSL hydrolase family protein n=1 Tax=Jatrophihabitans sp. GAS493 TaxID=1907575 RepID=UPI000BB7E8C3|nr:SGNH/GDSL hydrolase family protein [Jatrophihabitans sp. GAS493]SOD75178.1 lysophospholipase L1-like esterase [Jatrophihabitans sp. GAS493]
MSRASRARRIATTAAYGGTGLGAVGLAGAAAFYGLIKGETELARRRIPEAQVDEGAYTTHLWAAEGVSIRRPPINVAMMGDSTAAGYGVARERDTPGVLLAIGISTVARRPVHLTNVAVVGAESSALPHQLGQLPRHLDLAIIMIGANDVTHRISAPDSVRFLGETVTELVSRGTAVVVGTCPDLGTIRPLAQPLRYFARRLSRNLAAAQTIATVAAGGRTVSLGDLLGPLFAADIAMFGADRFHPSERGYREAANAILPSTLDALGLRTRARSASTFTTQRPKPIARAAAQAVALPGAEVSATVSSTGRPWAQLRRRRPATAELDTIQTARATEAADGVSPPASGGPTAAAKNGAEPRKSVTRRTVSYPPTE